MATIAELCDKLMKMVSNVRIPHPKIPAALIASGTITRPGLSSMMMASEVISRLPETGAYFPDKLPSGSQNIMNATIALMCDVIVKHIKKNLKVMAVIPPGGVTIGIPNGVQVTNTNFVDVNGIGE